MAEPALLKLSLILINFYETIIPFHQKPNRTHHPLRPSSLSLWHFSEMNIHTQQAAGEMDSISAANNGKRGKNASHHATTGLPPLSIKYNTVSEMVRIPSVRPAPHIPGRSHSRKVQWCVGNKHDDF